MKQTHTKNASALRMQRGSFMLEASLALIVVAAIGGAAMMAYASNARRNEVKENAAVINEVIAEAQRRFGKTNQYPSVTTAKLVQSRAIPAELRDAGANTAHNSYGGAILASPVSAASCNASASGCMQLDWEAAPPDQCYDLVVQISSATRALTVDTTQVKALDSVLDDGLLASACDTDGPKTISMIIGR